MTYFPAKLSNPRAYNLVQFLAAMTAFWPVWLWYCERTADRSDEPLGIVALLTMVALAYFRKNPEKPQTLSFETATANVALMLGLVLLYCVLVPWAPHIVLAILAMVVVGSLLFRAGIFRQPVAGDWVLLLLSIPLVASLNFYLGYPMRLIASYLAASMLNLGGLAVSAQGAEIVCNSSIVGIDQPCSGIKMLWVALYLAATLSSLFRFNFRSTINMMIVALIAAIVANAIRVSSLFYIETKIIDVGPYWHGFVHSGIGAATFALLAGFLALAGTHPSIRYIKSAVDSKDDISDAKSSSTTRGVSRLPSVLVKALWQTASTLEKKTFGVARRPTVLLSFTIACLVAAAIPLATRSVSLSENHDLPQTWPKNFEGQPLQAVPLSNFNMRFAEGFPGRIAVFTTKDSRIVFRVASQPTRQLHASVSCYRASGYQIKWLPEMIDSNNHKWTVFEATKKSEKLLVRERFFDEQGNSWTDVSSWYWSAVLKQTNAPWWAVSVATRVNQEGMSF